VSGPGAGGLGESVRRREDGRLLALADDFLIAAGAYLSGGAVVASVMATHLVGSSRPSISGLRCARHSGRLAISSALVLLNEAQVLPGALHDHRRLEQSAVKRCHAELGLFAEGCAIAEDWLEIAEAAAHSASIIVACLGKLYLR
jgi:hypothetical protein